MTFRARLNIMLICFALICVGGSRVPTIKADNGSVNIPDTAVVDQHGVPHDFYTDLVKDKVVVINFVFTRCGMVCPMLGYKFGQLQKLLGQRAGTDVHLISISTDATYDTPARFKAWAKPFSVGVGWTQVTGEKQNIDHLLKSLKAFTADKQDHSTLILIGNDKTGQWQWLDGNSESQLMLTTISRLYQVSR